MHQETIKVYYYVKRFSGENRAGFTRWPKNCTTGQGKETGAGVFYCGWGWGWAEGSHTRGGACKVSVSQAFLTSCPDVGLKENTEGGTAELLATHHEVESALCYNAQLSQIGDSSTPCR